MTIACAYKTLQGDVWIGADSRITSGDGRMIEHCRGDDKIISAGEWKLAFAGTSVVSYHARRRAAEIADTQNAHQVAEWLQALYRELRMKPVGEEGGAPYYRVEAILACPFGVWELESDGDVSEPLWGFVAIGTGRRYALATAMALQGGTIPKTDKGDQVVRRAIEIACEFDNCSAPPVIVVKV